MSNSNISKTKKYMWIPKLIILFFVIVISADIALIYIAESAKNPLSTKKNFSTSELLFKATSEKLSGKLYFTFRDEKGVPQVAPKVQVKLSDNSNNVHEVELLPVSGITGRYQGKITFCCAGEWKAQIYVKGVLQNQLELVVRA